MSGELVSELARITVGVNQWESRKRAARAHEIRQAVELLASLSDTEFREACAEAGRPIACSEWGRGR